MILEQLASQAVLGPLDVQFAVAVTRLAGDSNPDVRLAAALACKMTAAGHACADLRVLAGQRVVRPDGEPCDIQWPQLDAWTSVLRASPLVTGPVHDSPITTPMVLDGRDRLFLTRYWEYQERLAGLLLRRANRAVADIDEKRLQDDIERMFDDEHQAQAARAATTRHLAVISGGPGTGKTTTVVRILALLQQRAIAKTGEALSVRLLAPTGKAAARLAEANRLAREGTLVGRLDDAVIEAIDVDAATIHRALRWRPWSPTRFAHGPDHPLSADVVVVDEASMVDLALMTKLVEAVRSDARLILLGDRDQLASVEAGATLGDICAAGLGIQLTHNFRFDADSAIGQIARSINAGDDDRALALLRDPRKTDLEWIEASDERTLVRAIGPLIQAGYGPLVGRSGPADGLERLGRFRVLAALRSGPFGVAGLNALSERILPLAGTDRRPPSRYPGQPVMVRSNDYAAGLFNGDVGLLDRGGSGRLGAFFPSADGSIREIPPARLPRHQTVYAMTVHKSQGSEFDEVLVVLPPRLSPVVTRELLYTAVTRARIKVTLVGPTTAIRHAIRTPVRRTSGLRDRLRNR